MSTSETPTPSVLLIGGPDAGKSNFLFRLWLAVDTGAGTLVKDTFPNELEYLRTGLETLLLGNFAGRTSGEVLEHVTIPVKSANDGSLRGVLNVPDVPGERVQRVYESREWDSLWEDRIVEGCGCLVFIRAGSGEVVRPLDYTECLKLFGDTLKLSNASSATTAGSPSAAEETARDASGSSQMPAAQPTTNESVSVAPLEPNVNEPPTDVILTDWLQFLRRAFTDRVRGSYRPKIGIVIAAWDGVPNDTQKSLPIEYLKDNFPMLEQFIETNHDLFDFQVFGLSILGGDLKNDEEFKTAFTKGKPNDFGFVIHSINGTIERVSDTTLPVAWALGWFPVKPPTETDV